MAKKKKTDCNWIRFTGGNAIQLMHASGAYHVNCGDEEIILWFKNKDNGANKSIKLLLYQYLVIENDEILVKDIDDRL